MYVFDIVSIYAQFYNLTYSSSQSTPKPATALSSQSMLFSQPPVHSSGRWNKHTSSTAMSSLNMESTVVRLSVTARPSWQPPHLNLELSKASAIYVIPYRALGSCYPYPQSNTCIRSCTDSCYPHLMYYKDCNHTIVNSFSLLSHLLLLVALGWVVTFNIKLGSQIVKEIY